MYLDTLKSAFTSNSSWDSLNKLKLEILASGEKVLDFSMINPKEDPPKLAIDKLIEAITQKGSSRYTSSSGIRLLRKAFTTKYEDRFSTSLDPDVESCISFGSKDALAQSLRSLTEPGQVILLPKPYYPTHYFSSLMNSLKVCTFDIDDSETKTLDNLISTTKKHSPSLILLNFPNNPTGKVVSSNFYQEMFKAISSDILVINDFVYGELLAPNVNCPSILSVGTRPNNKSVLEIYSLSKAYSVPGWRVGALLGDKSLIAIFSKLKSWADYGLYTPLQIASSHILLEEGAYAQKMANLYHSRAKVMAEVLSESKNLQTSIPNAGCSLWAELKNIEDIKFLEKNNDSVEIAKSVLRKHKVAILPSSFFGVKDSAFFRFSLVNQEHDYPALKDIFL